MSKTRNVYLKMKNLQEAREIVHAQFPVEDTLGAEAIPVPDSVGRVLAEPVFAKISAPHFNAAAMDGLAVKAERTFGASEAVTKELEIGQDVFYVNTGHVPSPTMTSASQRRKTSAVASTTDG